MADTVEFRIDVQYDDTGHITKIKIRDDMEHADQNLDNFLTHYGVKGMRWGKRKSGDSGDSLPSRKELRDMNKVARARIRKEKDEAAKSNDQAIKTARNNLKPAYQNIKTANKQYKEDKRKIGSVAAKEIFDKNTKKDYDTISKSAELTRGEKVVGALFLEIIR